jgi:hypothetical protein
MVRANWRRGLWLSPLRRVREPFSKHPNTSSCPLRSMQPALHPDFVRARQATALCLVFVAVGSTLIAFGTFGGWSGEYKWTDSRYDYDRQRTVFTEKSQAIGARGSMLTDLYLVAPLAAAIAGLVVCAAGLVGMRKAPDDVSGRYAKLALRAAIFSGTVIGVAGIVYAVVMAGASDWWFAEAFYGGLSSAVLIVVFVKWARPDVRVAGR